MADRGSKREKQHKHLLTIVRTSPLDYAPWGTVERWAEPGKPYPDCSNGCKHAAWLAGSLGADWLVCTNPNSHRVGLLTFEHQSGVGCFEDPETRRSSS